MTLLDYLLRWGWFMLGTLACAIINWISVVKRAKPVEFIFKPLTLVVLLLVAYLMKNSQHSAYLRTWFVPALFFSLCGDIFLMFSGNRYFLLGLLSFLFAHLCYIVGLNPNLPPAGAWGIFMGVVILYVFVYPNIDRGLVLKGDNKLRFPAALYAVVLSLMLGSAWTVLLRSGWSPLSQVTIIAGSCLFYISDLSLAWNRFVKYAQRRDLLTIMTYHLAQILLTASIAFGPQ
jgi:uncharacterized membrane protein YhhN